VAGWIHNKAESGASLWLKPIANPGTPWFKNFTGQVYVTETGAVMYEASTTGPPR
jgi:hypothetical protein